MKTRLVLKPGDRGTKKVVDEYGGKLVCVRYRYDGVLGRRLKTAEIILEEVPWRPRGVGADADADAGAGAGSQERGESAAGAEVVGVWILYEERELRQRVKAAGGRWASGRRVWELDRRTVRRLGLEDRIVGEGARRTRR